MRQKLFTIGKKLLPIIGIILFAFLIYELDPQKILASIQSIPLIYIGIAALLTIPVFLLRNIIWMMIHKQQHIHISFLASQKIFLIGYFYGAITPGYFGQLMRIPYMKEHTNERYGKLFVNTFLETTLHTLSLYIMMLLGGFLILSIYPGLFVFLCVWLVIILLLFAFFVNKKRGEPVLHALIKYLIPGKAKNAFTQFIETFYADFPRVHTLVIPCLLGALTWIITFSQIYLIAVGLGVDVPYGAVLLLLPIANTVGLLPITFAGLGTRELTAIILFSALYGVAQTDMFVISLVGFLVTDMLTGFYGFLLSIPEARNKRKIPKIMN